jgi:hypothetical protein
MSRGSPPWLSCWPRYPVRWRDLTLCRFCRGPRDRRSARNRLVPVRIAGRARLAVRPWQRQKGAQARAAQFLSDVVWSESAPLARRWPAVLAVSYLRRPVVDAQPSLRQLAAPVRLVRKNLPTKERGNRTLEWGPASSKDRPGARFRGPVPECRGAAPSRGPRSRSGST